jgi:regulator of protease activity HflC (stomatin/prohibitin superfamily)
MKERFTPSTPKKEKTNIHTERHFVEILTNAEKVNEGSNAYILKTKQETEHDAQALKLLKLYQRGEGQREANAQKKAFEIITNASSQAPEQYAKVPELYEVNEIKLDTNTKTKLENRGVKMLSNESECLSMEFIEGGCMLQVAIDP